MRSTELLAGRAIGAIAFFTGACRHQLHCFQRPQSAWYLRAHNDQHMRSTELLAGTAVGAIASFTGECAHGHTRI